MSFTRRQFLLSTAGASAGAIIPDFYFRALQFFEQFGEPLLEPPAISTSELFTFDNCGALELCLGNPFEEPPQLSYREYYERYGSNRLESFMEDWDLAPDTLDDPMDTEHYGDCWFRNESPNALAYHYLQSHDLGPDLIRKDAAGGLVFFEDSNMVSCWNGVRYDDAVTLSLLQQRLNDLGTGVRIVDSDFAV